MVTIRIILLPQKPALSQGKGDFIMVINQDKGCDSKIWGTATDAKDPKATPQTFEGKVIP
jgi:hypothetical protein